MIEYLNGDLLRDDADALVNTVNCVGIMGKGIALAFKRAYPENYEAYRMACVEGSLRPGGLFATDTGLLLGPRQIINVATKDDWRDPSQIGWVEQGIVNILHYSQSMGFGYVAVPALGCSNGGLRWPRVRPIMERHLSPSKTVFRIYPPPDPGDQA